MSKDEYDPMGHSQQFLKDSYRVTKAPEEDVDLLSAGLNGYGDFVLVGKGGQVVRVRDSERIKLAAYLLAPILETEPAYMETANRQIEHERSQKDIDPRFRTPMSEPGKSKKKAPQVGRKGIIARV